MLQAVKSFCIWLELLLLALEEMRPNFMAACFRNCAPPCGPSVPVRLCGAEWSSVRSRG